VDSKEENLKTFVPITSKNSASDVNYLRNQFKHKQMYDSSPLKGMEARTGFNPSA
jgi:hypothetical protein